MLFVHLANDSFKGYPVSHTRLWASFLPRMFIEINAAKPPKGFSPKFALNPSFIERAWCEISVHMNLNFEELTTCVFCL